MPKTTVKERLTYALYTFEVSRKRYELSPSKTGFFQPFKTPADFQQQIKTTLVSPIIGLMSVIKNISPVIESVLIMAVSIPCLSPSLFTEGLVNAAGAIVSGTVTPLIACAVTLASLLSIVTRTLATIFSWDSGELKNEFLSFLPENPVNQHSKLV